MTFSYVLSGFNLLKLLYKIEMGLKATAGDCRWMKVKPGRCTGVQIRAFRASWRPRNIQPPDCCGGGSDAPDAGSDA